MVTMVARLGRCRATRRATARDRYRTLQSLGRGFLTGQITSPNDFAPDDFRRTNPRFQGENFQRNLDLVAEVRRLAGEKHIKAGQLALAWLLSQGEDVVPIPGTKRRVYLEENMNALRVTLSAMDLQAIDETIRPDAVAGQRYADEAMKAVNL